MIFFLQPLIAHYRKEFYENIHYPFLILSANDGKELKITNKEKTIIVKKTHFFKFKYYHIFKILFKHNPKIVITFGEIKLINNFIFIIFKYFFDFKIIFWSQGLQFNKGIRTPLLKFLFDNSDGVMFYTKECYDLSNIKAPSTYLNNTVYIDDQYISSKKTKKDKTINGLFISRFSKKKKPNKLYFLMKKIHSVNTNINFNIIGSGDLKPVFKENFIIDHGKVYNNLAKKEIFENSDFLFMPYFIGLSVVECFANGLPVFTLSKDIELHSVEYSYIKNDYNGKIFNSEEELIDFFDGVSIREIQKLGNNARNFYKKNLQMKHMYSQANNFINKILNDE
tara:strand:- start:487 stop:1500 length:1014 start_codon:yes stop_codon:yes gene_type:complete